MTISRQSFQGRTGKVLFTGSSPLLIRIYSKRDLHQPISGQLRSHLRSSNREAIEKALPTSYLSSNREGLGGKQEGHDVQVGDEGPAVTSVVISGSIAVGAAQAIDPLSRAAGKCADLGDG